MDSILTLNENVAPFMLSATLVLAAELNVYTAYMFVFTLVTWMVMTVAYLVALSIKHGIWRTLYSKVRWLVELVVRRLYELREFYLVKVFIGVMIAYVIGSTCYWLYHLDIVQLCRATLDFLHQIPFLLWNAQQLVISIQEWLHAVFLAPVVDFIAWWWGVQKTIIGYSFVFGLCSIVLHIAVVLGILEVCVAIRRNWDLSSNDTLFFVALIVAMIVVWAFITYFRDNIHIKW